jgi:hypothetical protein
MKTIHCLSIEAVGPKVWSLSWRNFMLTLTPRAPWRFPTLLLFIETKTIPRRRIKNEDFAHDVIIQREAPRAVFAPIYRTHDTSAEIAFE